MRSNRYCAASQPEINSLLILEKNIGGITDGAIAATVLLWFFFIPALIVGIVYLNRAVEDGRCNVSPVSTHVNDDLRSSLGKNLLG